MSPHAPTARAEHVVFNSTKFRSHSIDIKMNHSFKNAIKFSNQSDRHEVFPILPKILI